MLNSSTISLRKGPYPLLIVGLLLGLLLVSMMALAQSTPAIGSSARADASVPKASGHPAPGVGSEAKPANALPPGRLVSLAALQPPPPAPDNLVVSGTVYFDAARSSSTVDTPTRSQAITVTSVTSFTVGDEILIMNMLGDGVGTWETGIVSDVVSNALILSGTLQNRYNGMTDEMMVRQVPHHGGARVKDDGVGNRQTVTETLWHPGDGAASLPGDLFTAADVPADAGAVTAAHLPSWMASTDAEKEGSDVPEAEPLPASSASTLLDVSWQPALVSLSPFVPNAEVSAAWQAIEAAPLISATLVPTMAQMLATPDGSLILTVPAGAVPVPTPLRLYAVDPAQSTLPENWTAIGPIYQLDNGLSFALPVTATLTYGGESEWSLAVHVWYEKAWHALDTKLEPAVGHAATTMTRLQWLALLEEIPTDAPITPTVTPTATSIVTPTGTPSLTPPATSVATPTSRTRCSIGSMPSATAARAAAGRWRRSAMGRP